MKLGDTLKEVRESKELTVQAVADAIHLSVKQINALEANNFNLLPEPVTTRGFIRSYARFLEIDSEPLLANYREQVPHQDPNTIVMSGQVNKVISEQEQSPWLMYILGSIIVLLLLVVWFYYMDNVNEWSDDSGDDIVLEESIESAVDGSDVATIEGAISKSSEEASNSEIATDESGEETSDAAPEQGVVNETETLTAAPVPTEQVVTEALVLRLKEACWVSIKTANGKTVIEKLLPAGTEQGFDVELPFKLKIGNATSASVHYDNQLLDLTDYTRGSVARVTVTDTMLADARQKILTNNTAIDKTKVSEAQNAVANVGATDGLVIKTNEACWVSVKNSAGQKVFEKLLPPASNQVIAVSKPFSLTIGNASAAQASYQNQALDLESNKQHNVAKLKVE